jgi:hypothetical protein
MRLVGRAGRLRQIEPADQLEPFCVCGLQHFAEQIAFQHRIGGMQRQRGRIEREYPADVEQQHRRAELARLPRDLMRRHQLVGHPLVWTIRYGRQRDRSQLFEPEAEPTISGSDASAGAHLLSLCCATVRSTPTVSAASIYPEVRTTG